MTYTSMRLQVLSTAASSMCGYAHSSAMARGHSASGVASFSRRATGAVCTLRPMATMELLGASPVQGV